MFWTKKSAASFVPKRVIDALHRNFTSDELEVLARLGTMIEVDAGSKLTVEDTLGREALVMVAGTASVLRGGNRVATIKPGEIIGEMSLLSGARRNATVIADSAVTVYALSSREFASLMASCPRLAARTTATALRRLTAA